MKKGEIYLINFDPAFGSEIQKVRPGIILQSENMSSKLVTVMPISSKVQSKNKDDIFLKKDRQNRLFSDSIVKTSQISSFDKRRFIHFIGSAHHKTLQEIERYLKKHFEL